MKIELLTICDHAVDYGGKMCVLGMFEGLRAPSVPASHPHCTILARIRFYPTEAATHKVSISITDEDGKPIIQPLIKDVPVHFPGEVRSMIFNMLFNINGLRLPKFGEYAVNLVVNGEQKSSTPLYLSELRRQP
jgi:hypothetical protein